MRWWTSFARCADARRVGWPPRRSVFAEIHTEEGPWLELMSATPCVSVVMPVRNEAGFIAELLRAVFAQDYPADCLEVIVADGMSTDGTRDILAGLQAQYPHLVIVDNPGRIVSTGLNLAVARARGEIILRIDGHALIAGDFVKQNVALL